MHHIGYEALACEALYSIARKVRLYHNNRPTYVTLGGIKNIIIKRYSSGSLGKTCI